MIKMKLPMRTAEEGGEEAAEDAQEQPDSGLHVPCPAAQTASSATADPPGRLGYPVKLDKERVFEWFGLHLDPAKRIEFMCGLLHMCQPLELRFLGSCLEDLARKDFHVLRDFEIRANSPSELGLLGDVTDPVVRSKLLVCLSLLGSENRECAGILFRILSHADPALYFKAYDFSAASSCAEPRHLQLHPPCEDGDACGRSPEPCAGPPTPDAAGVGLLEQLALLFTMASLHPAFHFHQRESVRLQLDKVDLAMEGERRRQRRHHHHGPQQQQQQQQHQQQQGTDGPMKVQKTDYLPTSTDTSLKDRAQPHRSSQSPSRKSQREGKGPAVYIEKIMLKGISWSRNEKEYSFEVKWSDSSSSSVTKTQQELENFLLKLPKELSTESFEKLLKQGESRELERTLKEKFLSASQVFRQTGKVCAFFLSDSPGPNCSRYNPGPLGKSFQQDCSEASSQDEGVYLEPYVLSHRKKHGCKSPSLSQSGKNCPVDGRRALSSELNGVPDWRRKSCPPKTILEPRAQGGDQPLADDNWNSSRGNNNKARAPPTDREKGQAGQSRPGAANGAPKLPAVPMIRQPAGKDAHWDTGSGQDSYGETSSESYSSPSSPQHDGRESLESEDEKDRETDSHSDDYSKGKTDHFPPCKAVSGAAVATVHPMVSMALKEEPSRSNSPLNAATFPQIPFVHSLPFVVQNGACAPEATGPLHGADGKAAMGVMSTLPSVLREPISATGGTGEAEKTSLLQEPTSLPHVLSPSPMALPQPGSPGLQPLIQRFKSTALQASSESCSASAHQTPVGAISVIPAGPAYMSSLQPAYPSSDSVMGSGLAHSVPLVEQHAKASGLSLSAGLPPSYTLPIPTTVIPSVGAVSSSAMSQAQVIVPPTVPTHTPGPAPSPSPALTHSTAQSDSTSCGTSTGASPQQPQQQSSPSQQVGCGACGCRGTCGSNHAPSYYFPPQMPRQVLSVPHIFHLTSLAHQSNGATQLPFFTPTHSPYASGPLLHTHSDHVLGTQVGYSMQQMAAFNRFYQPVFPPVNIMPSSTMGAGMKKNGGNISCYNCGVSGHYAQDCKQPSIDATQQGGFRLKYVTPQSPETLDKAE
ncbi:zinc finger CCHC domain-containing protein 2-like isoform X2 [Scleropages formosus]|uniref:zinc finger CCHC domain-containing protein 2-like isoform X2 n=1 Tax=Scleropages formosus TaxID=113540 RepID=UPI0010FA7DF1|nr:zinc finger CCHC domain-containing protein 2-like isoform X2 [Scleropages formosus]